MGGIVLCTLVLNEMEWLPRLYQQHREWPELERWIFVEAADRVFAEANPELVSSGGLSVDGTTDYLEQLARYDSKVVHIRFGVTNHSDPAQCKIPARQAYLDAAAKERPEFVFVLDADEFYTRSHQSHVIRIMRKFTDTSYSGFMFKQKHVWHPESIRTTEPLFKYEVTGGYWSIPHTRGWRYRPGMRYINNHNSPEGCNIKNVLGTEVCCVHMGFASMLGMRKAKHKYYVTRGEGTRDRRQMYVDCRRAFESWKPGEQLPHKARVELYGGPIPEVFV